MVYTVYIYIYANIWVYIDGKCYHIWHTWILWVISHHIRLYSLDLRDIPSGNAGDAHLSPQYFHGLSHREWEFPIATLGSTMSWKPPCLLSYMVIYRFEYI